MNSKTRHLSTWMFVFFLSIPILVSAQKKKKIKLGEFSKAEKEMTDCDFEPGSPAVVLLDKANAEMSLDVHDGFMVTTTRHVRIKILSKDGYDYADVEIPFSKHIPQALSQLKAATFNPTSDGDWERTDVDPKEIFEEVKDKKRGIKSKKFAFPNVKVGSIIEYTYREKNGRMENWVFQRDLPVVNSELNAYMIDNFQYYIKEVGAHPIERETGEMENYYLSIPGAPSVPLTARKRSWKVENLPSFREDERFPAAARDYISHVSFLLKAVKLPGQGASRDYAGNYLAFTKKLLKDPDFGKHIDNDSEPVLAKLGLRASGDPKKDAKAIFDKINGMEWNEEYFFAPEFGPARTIKKGGGGSAELNMLLIAALREAGIKAFPVVSYKRGYGTPDPTIPDPYAYDYLLCAIDFDGSGKDYTLLDATTRNMPFGQLKTSALNGSGWLVDIKRMGWLPLKKGAMYDKTVGVKLRFEDGKIKGELKSRLKGYACTSFFYAKDEEAKKEREDDFKKKIADGWESGDLTFKAEDKEKPVVVSTTLEKEVEMEDIIYLEPIVMRLFDENPFKEEERLAPVDFAYAYRFQYAASIEIPEGYVAEEVPDEAVVTMPDGYGKFILSAKAGHGKIQVNVMLAINKLYYNPVEEYNILREFLMLSFEKMEGMVVLKKVE